MASRTPKPKADDASPADENEQPKKRSFQLRAPKDGDEQPVIRISFGHDPRVSIGAGDAFSIDDEKLAARLAADPNLEEISK